MRIHHSPSCALCWQLRSCNSWETVLIIARGYYRGVKSGNQQFARDVTAWTFQESLVLRIDQVEHHRVNETLPQETYTINDQVVSSRLLNRMRPVLHLFTCTHT